MHERGPRSGYDRRVPTPPSFLRPAGVERATVRMALPVGFIGLAVLVSELVPLDEVRWVQWTAATLCLAVVAALFAWSITFPERTWREPAAAYLFFLFALVARDAAGGVASGISAIYLVPILWLALTGTRRELWGACVLALMCLLLPILAIGPPDYPLGDIRRGLILTAVAVTIGPVIQQLVRRRSRAQARAEAATDRVEKLFHSSPHGVALLDGSGRIMAVNAALASWLGRSETAVVGDDFTRYAPMGDDGLGRHLARLAASEDEETVTDDCVLRSADGSERTVALSSRIIPDRALGEILLVNLVDISERRQYQDRLSHLVDHDVLTGVANRRGFSRQLEAHLAAHPDGCAPGGVLLLDLDHFKQVNDTLGHNAGDRMLVEVAKLLTGAVRGSDVVGRLGGDEFVILLTEGDERGVERVASVVVEQVRQYTATLEGAGRRVTASVGGLSFRSAADHTADVLALADMTMYESKDGGRDQAVVLAEGDLRPLQLSVRMEWEERIEQALATDGFELHLQPIMEVATGEIGSAEVLLRMRTEDGLQPPGAFLPIAERTGLMTKIDAWVARHSVPLLARLQQVHPGFRLQVNLSGYSIGNPEIERTIREALARNCVGRGALIFEVTETAAVADVAVAREFAERLVDLGCAFALDDYGAGYGSLHYLKHLLFDYVKIDGEFVADSHHSEVDRTILRSIAGVARGLGKRTIAEFVEDPAVLEVLREEGVDQAQGYLVGRPVPVEEFMEIHLRPGAGTGGVTE